MKKINTDPFNILKGLGRFYFLFHASVMLINSPFTSYMQVAIPGGVGNK